MPYIPTFVLLAVGLVLLAVLVIRLARGLRRFNQTTNMVVTNTKEKVGLLRARAAGVRVAFAQRKG